MTVWTAVWTMGDMGEMGGMGWGLARRQQCAHGTAAQQVIRRYSQPDAPLAGSSPKYSMPAEGRMVGAGRRLINSLGSYGRWPIPTGPLGWRDSCRRWHRRPPAGCQLITYLHHFYPPHCTSPWENPNNEHDVCQSLFLLPLLALTQPLFSLSLHSPA
jgi:hypothetical protein